MKFNIPKIAEDCSRRNGVMWDRVQGWCAFFPIQMDEQTDLEKEWAPLLSQIDFKQCSIPVIRASRRTPTESGSNPVESGANKVLKILVRFCNIIAQDRCSTWRTSLAFQIRCGTARVGVDITRCVANAISKLHLTLISERCGFYPLRNWIHAFLSRWPTVTSKFSILECARDRRALSEV